MTDHILRNINIQITLRTGINFKGTSSFEYFGRDFWNVGDKHINIAIRKTDISTTSKIIFPRLCFYFEIPPMDLIMKT